MPKVSTLANSSSLTDLKVPKVDHRDLVIIGGGPSGITAAMRLVQAIEDEEKKKLTPHERSSSRFRNLSSVTLLAGGPSLAFSPVAGDFGAFLTLYGSDSTRRDLTLASSRAYVEKTFAQYRFDFKTNSFARKIEMAANSRFIIKADVPHGSQTLSAEKVIVALGHSLKERPVELRNHIFKGSNDLCTKLQSILHLSASPEECLDRLLSSFQRTPEGVVRIALVGLGSTFLEAIKIFHSLLDAPHNEQDVYRTRGSRTPVEFTLFDSRLISPENPLQSMISSINAFHAHISDSPAPGGLLTPESVIAYKTAEKARFQDLIRTRQISVIPERFDWTSAHLDNNFISCRLQNKQLERFSCVVDCSPFNVGISREQHELLRNIPALRFTPNAEGTFSTELESSRYSSSIALVGAAFAPKDKWGLGTMNEHGIRAIKDLFPS